MKATYQPVLFAMFVAITGCAQGDPDIALHPAAPNVNAQTFDKPIGLAIHGFNYTDRVISSFSINHQGGGNIFVSSPTSGGGKTTCCMSWRPGYTLAKMIKIEWMRDIDGNEIWCKKEITLKPPFPARPKNVAVHFMPDGDIQVELTEQFPALKLSLDQFDAAHRKEIGNSINDENVAECRHDKHQLP